ncbi:hypothetical protein Aasi_1157 [Candidatus Amoebophilus asiaticus 5a2]|uniref:DUF4296 domain-containing protein n=1 Tax=Amoebophilus asiaticus (strain 5a2) TaxID=452471 RepID=B3ETE1_AMOA5|nr:DUF4296 domain-containing protein [Candidatus Amoebophilus asiaticus]ACE06493.1 hypothetical protein Aasi_1157 [Candidatus Amoebophilus asiaticus 5a2]
MKKILALVMACGLISQNLAHIQSSILTQDQLIEILADLELAKAMLYTSEDNKQTEIDNLFQEQAQLIYETHATDAVTLQESYIEYLNNPIRLQWLYDQLIVRLEKLLREEIIEK